MTRTVALGLALAAFCACAAADFDADFSAGVAAFRAGEFQKAVKLFRDCARERPNDAAVQAWLGTSLLNAGLASEALPLLTIAASARPDDPVLHNNLGVALSRTGNAERAIAEFQKALELKPDYPEARENLAQALLRAGRNADAARLWLAALEANPNDANAHFRLGQVFLLDNDLTAAILHFEAAANDEPDNPTYATALARAYLAHGSPSRAAAVLRPLIDAGKASLGALDCYGAAALALGEHKQAAQALERAAAMPGAPFSVHYNLGVALLNLARYDEAQRALDRAAQLRPDDPAVLNALGWLLWRKGDSAAAEEKFRAAIAADPDCLEARRNLAVLLDNAGRYAELAVQLKEILRLADDPAVRRRLVEISLDGPAPEPALLDEIAKMREGDFSFLCRLGHALVRWGRYDDAVEVLQKAVSLNKSSVVAHNNLGVAFERKGMLAEALKEYKLANHIDPEDKTARQNMERLQKKLQSGEGK